MRGDLSSIDLWARKMSTLKDAQKPDKPSKAPRRRRLSMRRLLRRSR
jgi:hypothetical protein